MSVDHWFDFICPYCYIGQDRTRILREQGIAVTEHGMQIHPEIKPGGVVVGPRTDPRYEYLAAEAKAAGLPLHWTDRIAYSRPALEIFEWLDPKVANRFAKSVFTAYFANSQDMESPELLKKLAEEAGGSLTKMTPSTASDALARSEALARSRGVDSTPTWLAGDQRISGLKPRSFFEQWAKNLEPPARK